MHLLRFKSWLVMIFLIGSVPPVVAIDFPGLPVGPAKGEVSGWSAWAQRKGILSFRNPSDQPATISLDIGEAFELPPGAARTYSLKSSWGESDRASPIILTAGVRHSFELKPFDVLTLDAMPISPQ